MRAFAAIAALLITVAFTIPAEGSANLAHWALGRMFGTWTIHTTPHYKGHSPAGMHAVCVNDITDEERIVPITPRQAYGDPVTGEGALLKDGPCPPAP